MSNQTIDIRPGEFIAQVISVDDREVNVEPLHCIGGRSHQPHQAAETAAADELCVDGSEAVVRVTDHAGNHTNYRVRMRVTHQFDTTPEDDSDG